MKQKHVKEIEEIIGTIKCPKDFICYRSGFKKLCEAKDIGMESFLVCLEDKPVKCYLTLNVEEVVYCQCPLRVYISKKLKK